MTREELTKAILAAKKKKKLSWAKIAQAGGLSPAFVTAACMGQMQLPEKSAQGVAEILGLTAEAAELLQEIPYRGSLPTAVPSDPLIYRFYELVQVYGTTWKELIQEEFGDGIMSAIDFEMDLTRLPDAKGDRVKIVMHGKFLGYRKW